MQVADGKFIIEHIRDGVVIERVELTQKIVTEGKNYLLDVDLSQCAPCEVFFPSPSP